MSDGAYALVGVFVGAVLTWIFEFTRHRFERRTRAKFLAVRSVIALDVYVRAGASKLSPDPQEEDSPDTSVQMPEKFQPPSDVDWTAIDPTFAYDLLSLPDKDAHARDSVSYIFQVADSWQAKDTRDEHFSKVGLTAAALAGRLRRVYGLPARAASEWDPVEVLAEISSKIQKRAADRGAGL